jgi:hypothetical protein
MNCTDAEILICDYATLSSSDRFELERHMEGCPACAELARDSAAALAFMERAADVEPPPALVNRILFDERWKQQAARGSGLRAWIHKVTQPVLQPKFAMSMAITILSLAWLVKYVAPARPVTAADFNPVRVWQSLDDRVYRGYQRTVKFYESIKFVYQVRARLQEWNQQQDEEQSAAAERKQNPGAAEKSMDEKRLPVKNAPAENSAPNTVEKSSPQT